jgi:hypothetical protein
MDDRGNDTYRYISLDRERERERESYEYEVGRLVNQFHSGSEGKAIENGNEVCSTQRREERAGVCTETEK